MSHTIFEAFAIFIIPSKLVSKLTNYWVIDHLNSEDIMIFTVCVRNIKKFLKLTFSLKLIFQITYILIWIIK